MKIKKSLALLSAFIIVFTASFSGCAKKVTYKEKTTKADDKIVIGQDFADEDIPDDAEIVVGEDGQSYLVDDEGNSIVYEAPSAYVIPGQPVTVADPTTFPTKTTTTTKKTTTTTKKTTTTTTKAEKDVVYDTLRSQRTSGFVTPKGISNYNTDTLRVKFENNGMWLLELHKGSYGSKTIGGEAGLYYRTSTDTGYTKVNSSDEMKMSMTIWQYATLDGEPKELLSTSGETWWLAKFQNGTLSGSEPYTLVMKLTISFPTAAMMEAFADELEFTKGFEYGSNVSVKTPEKYTNDGNSITLIWKNATES